MKADENQGWTSLDLLDRYRAGDDLAAEALFARYFDRLTSMARGRLSARLARRADPEDVVLSAYRSFFVEAREGRYTLGRGGDLWRLLASITRNKLLKRARHERADRRSIDVEVPLGGAEVGDVPTPEEAAELADELERVISLLDPFGRRVLELRLQGSQVAEIAGDTGRSERSVRRALAAIRGLLAVRFDEPAEEAVDVPLLSDQDFLLRRMIGAGRMGKVYEAWWHARAEAVAVKFLRKSFLNHTRIVRRFLDESRTVAGLRHPNIIGTRGLGRTVGGSYFLVMDLVTGANLAGLGPVAVGDAVRWAIDLCAAIDHAHEMGVVHCDLKPANILLDESGTVRVADFGLARSLTDDTRWTAAIEGTAPFMAPEQAARCWGPIGRRTDVYGIGAVLFALLTGRPPHDGRRLSDILADVSCPAPVVSPAQLRPELPTDLVDLCRKCLAKDPADRYPTVREVRSALIDLGPALRGAPASSRGSRRTSDRRRDR